MGWVSGSNYRWWSGRFPWLLVAIGDRHDLIIWFSRDLWVTVGVTTCGILVYHVIYITCILSCILRLYLTSLGFCLISDIPFCTCCICILSAGLLCQGVESFYWAVVCSPPFHPFNCRFPAGSSSWWDLGAGSCLGESFGLWRCRRLLSICFRCILLFWLETRGVV